MNGLQQRPAHQYSNPVSPVGVGLKPTPSSSAADCAWLAAGTSDASADPAVMNLPDGAVVFRTDGALPQYKLDGTWYYIPLLGYTNAADHRLGDTYALSLGDSGDVSHTWSGSVYNTLPLADDTVWNIGNGTLSFDLNLYGNIPTALVGWDASASQLRTYGPVRMDLQGLPKRYPLRWIAGQRGKPALNADINSATEATREVADPDFELLGTNASSSSSTFYAEGGITLTTAGASGDEVILLPHLDTNQTAWAAVTWGTDKETEWECDLSTASIITATTIWAGLKLTNTATTATDNDQAFFRFETSTNSSKFQCVYSIGGADTAADSGVTVAISTRYHLKITIDSSRVARFYINGALVATSTALTNAVDLIPYIGVQAGAAAAKAINVHGQAISRNIG